jgi:glycosyltransferase involved in cell wall biosynthesis
MHAGNLGFYGAWDTLLKASQLLNGDGIGLVFVGDGALRERIRTSAHGSGSVRFLPFRPASEVGYVLAAGDLHVVSIRRGLEGVVVPSKLYPILAAGRPVLALASEESDVARIVRSADCGVVADPDDPSSVAAAISGLAKDPVRLAAMRRRAREISSTFEIGKELQHFREVVEAIVRSEGGESNSVV